jgi:hypothetical protein
MTKCSPEDVRSVCLLIIRRRIAKRGYNKAQLSPWILGYESVVLRIGCVFFVKIILYFSRAESIDGVVPHTQLDFYAQCRERYKTAVNSCII